MSEICMTSDQIINAVQATYEIVETVIYQSFWFGVALGFGIGMAVGIGLIFVYLDRKKT